MQTICFISSRPEIKNHWQSALSKRGVNLLEYNQIEVCLNDKRATDDILLVDCSGSSKACEENLASTAQNMNVVVLSNNPKVEEAAMFFKLGVKGYLNSYASKDILQLAVKTVISGQIWVGQKLMKSLIATSAQETAQPGWQNTLTQREISVAQLILKGKNNAEIAASMNITSSTVKKHIGALLKKFDAKDRLDLVIKIQNKSVRAA